MSPSAETIDGASLVKVHLLDADPDSGEHPAGNGLANATLWTEIDGLAIEVGQFPDIGTRQDMQLLAEERRNIGDLLRETLILRQLRPQQGQRQNGKVRVWKSEQVARRFTCNDGHDAQG